MRTVVLCSMLAGVAWPAPPRPRLSIEYSLRIDPSHLDAVAVAIHIDGAPDTLRLAMKVHPEYDAKYWRYLDSIRVDGAASNLGTGVTREDSTLWRITLLHGSGTVRYRVHVQPANGMVRAWRPLVRATGAMINSPDFLLYLPDFASAPVVLNLDVPRGWRIATSLEPHGAPRRFAAPSAAALLDAPIMLGDLHEWSFEQRHTRFHIAYWPLPDAAPFDTASFVDELRRLTQATMDIFGRALSKDYWFLIEDGAGDALEHQASLTIGLRSADLQQNPRASLTELAHEFFHTWNLVAIHPDGYGELSHERPQRTTGLWWGEGVTLYYADVLPRRAGLADSNRSRLDHLTDILRSYYAATWSTRVSPERASLAFGDSPVANPDATGSYYLQGELLGDEIDALVRDATHDRRGIDDIMRVLLRHSAGGRGFTSTSLEALTDSVCGCRLDRLFATQVRGSALIDADPVFARLGLRESVDTVPAVDSAGAPLPDLRLGVDFTRPESPLQLVVNNPLSAWSMAGLRTGDGLVALGGRSIASFSELQRVLHELRVGDTVVVDIERGAAPLRVRVAVVGYTRPRVRFTDLPDVTAEQRARRARWLVGGDARRRDRARYLTAP